MDVGVVFEIMVGISNDIYKNTNWNINIYI